MNETIANTQPLVLNGDGTVPNCFFSGSAKVILATSDDVQLWERDPVTAADTSSFGASWDSISIYSLNEVVTFNNVLYISIIANNQNNNPSTAPTAWTQFDLLKRWNANETYKSGDPVTASDFTVYLSLVNDNLGNDPTTDNNVNWIASGDRVGPAVLVSMSAVESTANNVAEILDFDTEIYDLGGFHDTGTNPSRLTVTANISYVRLSACVKWDANTAGYRQILIVKNGQSVPSKGLPLSKVTVDSVASTTFDQNVSSAPVAVSEGDYFELKVLQASGVNLDVLETTTWFAMEIVA